MEFVPTTLDVAERRENVMRSVGIWMYLENTSFRRKVSGRVFFVAHVGSCGYFCGRISFIQVCRATFLAAAKCETSQRGGAIFLPRINGLSEQRSVQI